MTIVLAELNSGKARISWSSITVAQLCDHFEQRELTRDNTWRSYSTNETYQAYLKRWVLPHWRHYEPAEVRTIQVESWLRHLPLAKSSCAKIRNLMSVLFNHACRYELFDRNPIYLVRQSAKRRRAPSVLMPDEIKAMLDNFSIRERTLVLPAVSTGLRQRMATKIAEKRRRQPRESVLDPNHDRCILQAAFSLVLTLYIQ